MFSHTQFSDRNGVDGTDFLTTSKASTPPSLSIWAMRDSICRSRELFFLQCALDLRPFHDEHRAQGRRRDLFFQQWADLLERQTQILEREDSC